MASLPLFETIARISDTAQEKNYRSDVRMKQISASLILNHKILRTNSLSFV
jgi:hypothetical protein